MRLIEPAFLFWGLLACGPVLRGAGVTYLPPAGAGNGKHIVLVAGDDEYHSEEALPQLARILAVRHGFRCTMLFTLNPADIYKVRLPLPADCRPLLLGEVRAEMAPTDPAVAGLVNDPMMPVAWTRSYRGESGKVARVFATTMGAADDLESEGFRRLLVNAAYWAVGFEKRIPAKANVDYVGEYRPHPFSWRDYVRGMQPADLAIR